MDRKLLNSDGDPIGETELMILQKLNKNIQIFKYIYMLNNLSIYL